MKQFFLSFSAPARLLLLLSAQLAAFPAVAQRLLTDHTYLATDSLVAPYATVYHMDWIAGSWTGSGLGGRSEEIWSDPVGESMMGMYRLVKGEKPVFYEMMTIRQHDSSLIMLIRHYQPDLTPMENADTVLKLPLIKYTKSEVYFSGITFWKTGKSSMRIFLAMRQPGGEYRETIFQYRKVKKKR